MVNVKKSITVLKYFVLILTLSTVLFSCAKHYTVTKIEAKQININPSSTKVTKYEDFISPYRKRIDKDLDSVLAYCPETLDKSKGQWQTNIGDFLANTTLKKANVIFKKRENKEIDLCVLNHGGIRSILPKGNVTTRNAFEIMPFENTSIVVALKGDQIIDIANHIVAEKKPHPISGLTFTIDNTNKVKDIKVNGIALINDKIYHVITSDYLSNGGDNMVFFKKGTQYFDLNYKLRNILIDYFKEVDTIPMVSEVKIIKEN